MIPLLRNKSQQIALFHIIHEDDIYLLNTADAEWFQVLYYLPWEKYLEYAVQYYNALYEFNQKQAREWKERGDEGEEEEVESKEEARQRLLFSRVTMQAESEIGEDVLFEVKLVLVKTGIEELPPSGVSQESIAPGKVPFRLGVKSQSVFCLAEEFYRGNDNGFSRRAGKGVYVIEE